MRIFDISQEVFGCVVFPGDPKPNREMIDTIKGGGMCNLSAFSMCAHNGTHIDAPYHFLNDGKRIDELPLESLVGYVFVACHDGVVSAEDIDAILKKASEVSVECSKRILIKGNATLSVEAAQMLAKNRILLFGNESQTIGPENAPAQVHKVMLGADIVLLEGIRLNSVSEGAYLLCAAPINLGGADGAPCRAVLIQL